jgi:hypothetical protein
VSCSQPIRSAKSLIAMTQKEQQVRFPLLEALLCEKGLSLLGTYTNRDVAKIFGVAVRTIQEWSRNGELKRRNLPGRGRFLSMDLEQFLQDSQK